MTCSSPRVTLSILLLGALAAAGCVSGGSTRTTHATGPMVTADDMERNPDQSIEKTLEAKVLQDADRLDAIGAIGIARCFATSADMKRPFYATDDPFCRTRDPDDKQWGIDHFYKKLLRIADGLHTATARAMARDRAEFMRGYLAQLEREIA